MVVYNLITSIAFGIYQHVKHAKEITATVTFLMLQNSRLVQHKCPHNSFLAFPAVRSSFPQSLAWRSLRSSSQPTIQKVKEMAKFTLLTNQPRRLKFCLKKGTSSSPGIFRLFFSFFFFFQALCCTIQPKIFSSFQKLVSPHNSLLVHYQQVRQRSADGQLYTNVLSQSLILRKSVNLLGRNDKIFELKN